MKNTDPRNNRMEFVFLFDVENGNPNGDPDAGNMPRVDPEDGRGLVTDVCLKRKVRNFIAVKCADQHDTRDIYVRERIALKERRKLAGASPMPGKPNKEVKGDEFKAGVGKNRELVCKRFYDVRTFGAVMPGEYNSGQVRGPVQMTFAKSINPVAPATVTITRVADEQKDNEGEIGNKHIIPYGLYRCHGFISPHFACDTGFDSEDLRLFWEALENMFDLDRSAARGLMTARKLVVFAHENPLGNAPAHKMLERVQVRRMDENKPPRQFADYEVEVDDENTPKGVEVEVKF